MKALIEKIRRARERDVEAGGHKFTVRRPTDEEAILMRGAPPLDFVKRFVVGWELTEMDILPGGGSAQKVPFDRELWAEWVADQPDLWEPLGIAALEMYNEHAKAREDDEKN